MISLDHERTERYSYDCVALSFAEDRPVARPRAATLLRVIGGPECKAPGALGISKNLLGFQKFFKTLL